MPLAKRKRTPEELAAWRQLKADKRLKQREANISRAKAMHQLWLANKNVSAQASSPLANTR